MSRAYVIVAALLPAIISSQALAASSEGNLFYARVEGGISNARDAAFRDQDQNSTDCFLMAQTAPPRCDSTLNQLGRGSTFGVGVGMKLPKGFRADVMFNHRQGYNLRGTDTAGTDFDPPVKSNGLMLSGTYDLPVVFGRVKPFIGGGIGRSRNELRPLKWNDPSTNTSGTLTGGKKSDTAYQLSLGAEISIPGDWTFELLYRYTDLGKFVKEPGPDQSGGPFNTSGITGAATGKLRVNEFIFALRRGF